MIDDLVCGPQLSLIEEFEGVKKKVNRSENLSLDLILNEPRSL